MTTTSDRTYINALGSFADAHTIDCVRRTGAQLHIMPDARGQEELLSLLSRYM